MLEILIDRNTEHEIRKRISHRLYMVHDNIQTTNVKAFKSIIRNKNTEKTHDFALNKPFILYREFHNISNEEDGNPIYQCELPTIRRQIRVIHEEISNSKNIQIGAWVNKSDSEYYKFDELVISLEPADEGLLIAQEISYCWLCKSLSIKQIESIIKNMIKIDSI